MKLRRLDRTEFEAREIATEIHVRSYRTNWDVRYVVEARGASGRALGDRDFATYADALAFAQMTAKWDRAKLLDNCGSQHG